MTTIDPFDRSKPADRGGRSATFAGLVPVLAVVIAALACVGCGSPEPPKSFEKRHLEPYPTRFPEAMPDLYAEQPERDQPRSLALAPERKRLYVALEGSIDDPGDEVVAVDTGTLEPTRHYDVGHNPTGLALHPGGRFLVVANRFSNFLSVIDLETDEVSALETDFYLVEPAFSSSGDRLYATNRWRDSLQTWDVTTEDGELQIDRVAPPGHRHGIPVGENPRDLAVAPDGARVYVAAQGGLTVSVVETDPLRRIELERLSAEPREGFGPPDPGRHVGAPPNDLALWQGRLYVPTLSASTHHRPFEGPDTNGDGRPGDGTPNFDFSDLQNEIAVFEVPHLQPHVRYTSDTICCFDFRDVSPTDSETFRSDPELRELLPSRSKWIVGGALPEQATVAEIDGSPRLVVIYSGSNEIQQFDIRADGGLAPGPKASTGFNPMGLAVDPSAEVAYVSNRLGETISVVDLKDFEVVDEVVVGDVSGGAFPATDAEIGEFLQFSGAAFSLDGDQTCNHCHRQQGAVGKTFHMPLLKSDRGTRNTMDHRGMFGTRPWFVEGAQDETNFFPVINEFARRENFCCPNVSDDPDCRSNPPEVCEERNPPRDHPTRDVFFLRRAEKILGRTESFGDAVDTQLDFLGMTRMLGVFLLQEPSLLPNPNEFYAGELERRGRRLFNSPETGCAGCHPPPTFASSFTNNPLDTPLRFGPVVTPNRSPSGKNLDLTDEAFLTTFPMAEQGANVKLKSISLQGIWDRPPPFLHDGRADSLREVLLPPDHPALGEDETGFNELDGMPDTHGGTSHLTETQVEALIAYLQSL